MPSSVAAGLRAWASGAYDQEAGVELLIRAFRGEFAYRGAPWVRSCDRPGLFWVDVSVLVDHLGGLSSGERRVLTVVAALIDGRPLEDVGGMLAGLDRRELALILAAFAHAAGSHEHSAVVREDDRIEFVRLPALVAWPATRSRKAA